MTPRKASTRAGDLISDPLSQMLFLKDVLATGDGPALVRAVNDVVRTWGFARLAERVNVDRATVDHALSRSEHHDFSKLTQLVAAIVDGWGELPDTSGARADPDDL